MDNDDNANAHTKTDTNTDNYHSKNIRKKDLRFNLYTKKSDQLAQDISKVTGFFGKIGQSFKNLWQKFISLPIFKGKIKFITLGIALVVIATAIALPIIIPEFTRPHESTSGEVEEERRESEQEVADVVNHVTPETTDEALDAILTDLDNRITNAASPEDATLYTLKKGTTYLNSGDTFTAVTIYESSLDDLYSQRRFTELFNIYGTIVSAYEEMFNFSAAIQWAERAIAAGEDVTTNHNEYYDYVPLFFQERIEQIKNNENYQQGVSS